MDKLKEASKMNETFSLAKTSPAPFDPTPLGGIWRAGYALTLREGPHHHLAKKHSLEWIKRRAGDFTSIFKNNLTTYLDTIEKGKSFKADIKGILLF